MVLEGCERDTKTAAARGEKDGPAVLCLTSIQISQPFYCHRGVAPAQKSRSLDGKPHLKWVARPRKAIITT